MKENQLLTVNAVKPKQTNPTERTTETQGKASGDWLSPVVRYIVVDCFTIVWYNQFNKSKFENHNFMSDNRSS